MAFKKQEIRDERSFSSSLGTPKGPSLFRQMRISSHKAIRLVKDGALFHAPNRFFVKDRTVSRLTHVGA
jgi:hypothetical protein